MNLKKMLLVISVVKKTSKVRVRSQCVSSYLGVLTDLIKTTMTTMAMTRTRTPTITPTTISVV